MCVSFILTMSGSIYLCVCVNYQNIMQQKKKKLSQFLHLTTSLCQGFGSTLKVDAAIFFTLGCSVCLSLGDHI